VSLGAFPGSQSDVGRLGPGAQYFFSWQVLPKSLVQSPLGVGVWGVHARGHSSPATRGYYTHDAQPHLFFWHSPLTICSSAAHESSQAIMVLLPLELLSIPYHLVPC